MAQILVTKSNDRVIRIEEELDAQHLEQFQAWEIIDIPSKSKAELLEEMKSISIEAIKVDGELAYLNPGDSKWYYIEPNTGDFKLYYDRGAESFIHKIMVDPPTIIKEAPQAEIDAEINS